MIQRIHLPLFLLAVTIAIGIKVAVNEALELTVTTINAQVRYNPPENVMILDPVRQVEVQLRGERNEIAALTPFNVQVEVSLKEGELGQVDITDERLIVRGPGDFEVLSKSPNRLALTVEELERRTLPVRPVLSGEPSAGAIAGTPVARPATAQVEGPRSRLRAVNELTAPVSLDGHAISFNSTVSVVSPDPLVKVVEPRQVEVSIPLEVPGSESPLDGLLEEPPDP